MKPFAGNTECSFRCIAITFYLFILQAVVPENYGVGGIPAFIIIYI